MLQVIHSVRHRIKKSVGCFAVYGYDFMIDENMKTWLIEINVNPALTTNTDVLIQAIPPAIEEGLRMYFLILPF
jgi:D-alanine-D-alanine ligase-like ATP-grasp enzyme